jgi:hypothetical protein
LYLSFLLLAAYIPKIDIIKKQPLKDGGTVSLSGVDNQSVGPLIIINEGTSKDPIRIL